MVGISKVKIGFMILITILGVVNLIGTFSLHEAKDTESGITAMTEVEIQEIFREGYLRGRQDALNTIIELHPDTIVAKLADSLSKE